MSNEELSRWEERFKSPEYVFGTEPNGFLLEILPLLPKKGRALALADGEGRNGVFLAEQGLDVLSVDFSPAGQAKAKALAQQRGVSLSLLTTDIMTWDWPEAEFDVVAGIFFQFATPEQRTAIFAKIRRALKPDGLLLLQGYRPEQIAFGTGGPRKVENLYSRVLLEAAFGDFTQLSIREYDEVIAEGTGHRGLSALIALSGRKPGR